MKILTGQRIIEAEDYQPTEVKNGVAMRFALLICAVLILMSCSGLQLGPAQITGIELLEYGLFKTHDREIKNNSTTAAGKHIVSDKFELYEKTTDIIAKRGHTFGIKYQIKGTPKWKKVLLTYNVIHPPIQGKTASFLKVKRSIGKQNALTYSFNEEYELVEGNWKMQIWHENEMLIEKDFITHINTKTFSQGE